MATEERIMITGASSRAALTARVRREARQAGRVAAFRALVARYDAAHALVPPAYRDTAEDDAWVTAQLAKRNRHVRRLAARLGISEEAARIAFGPKEGD